MVEIHVIRFLLVLMFLLPAAVLAQPTVKSFITVADMVAANPFQVADPSSGGTRTATVAVQESGSMYALTNTWSGTNLITLIASSTPDWAWYRLTAPASNIYNSDGEFTGNRVGDGAGKTLTLTNFPTLTLGVNGLLRIKTPKVNDLTATPTYPLTLLDTNGTVEYSVSRNLYTVDGTLTGARSVDLSAYPLVLQSAIPGGGLTVIAPTIDLESSLNPLRLASSSGMKIIIPSTTKQGDVLTVTDQNDGTVEFRTPVTSAIGNLYTTNGTLTGPRTVQTSSNSLVFNGTGGGAFTVLGMKTSAIDAGTTLVAATTNLTLRADKELRVRTPKVVAGTATDRAVLTYDGPTGTSEFEVPPNLYTTNGTVSDHRTVFGNSRDFAFTNFNSWSVRSTPTVTIGAISALNLRTPNVVNSIATTNQVLTLVDGISGKVEFSSLPTVTPTVDTSIYNTNGTITGSRSVTIPLDMYLRTIGEGTLILNSAVNNITAKTNTLFANERLVVGALTSMMVRTPKYYATTAKAGDVLTMVNPADGIGAVDFYTPTNIYNNDGVIPNVTRNVNFVGAVSDVKFNQPRYFIVDGTNVAFYARGALTLGTPKIFGIGGSASAGHVLTLQDAGTGRSEWAPMPAPVGAVNLYNQDGTLTGIRTLNSGNFPLTFDMNSGSRFRAINATYIDLFAKTNQIYSTDETLIAGTNRLRLVTPRVNTIGAASMGGQILTLAADGTTDFQVFTPSGVDTNLYSQDGILAGNRTVTGNSKNLTINGVNTFVLDGQTTVLAGRTYLGMITPNVQTASALAGQVLTLQQSGASGRVEFQTLPAQQSITNIYSGDGTLLGDRTVTGNNKDFVLTGTKTMLLGGNSLGLYAGTPGNGGKFNIGTPKIMQGGQISSGWVLAVTNVASGESEFMPLAATPTLYSANGNLNGTRAVGLVGNTLNWNGAGTVNYNSLSGYSVGSSTITHSASGANVISGDPIQLKTKKVNTGQGAQGMILTLKDGAGSVEFEPMVQLVQNLYTTNGALTGNRLVDGGAFNLQFSNIDDGSFSANHARLTGNFTYLTAANGFFLNLPNVAGRVAGNVLTWKADGTSDFAPPPVVKTFYTDNSALTTHRTVTGAAKNLSFVGLNDFSLSGHDITMTSSGTMLLDAANAFRIRTKNVQDGVAAADHVLTYKGDGSSDWLVAPNLYTKDGTLSGNRTVTLNGKTLTFNSTTAAGALTFNLAGAGLSYNAGAVNFSQAGQAFSVSGGPSVLLDSTGSLSATANNVVTVGTTTTTGSLIVKTPNVAQPVATNKPPVGSILTMQATDGRAEWVPLTSQTLGVIEYYGNTAGNWTVFASRTTNGSKLSIPSPSPIYTSTTNYPAYTRVIARAVSVFGDNPYNNDGSRGNIYLSLGSGPHKLVLNVAQERPYRGDITGDYTYAIPFGSMMELIYDPSAVVHDDAGLIDLGYPQGAWIMLDFGVGQINGLMGVGVVDTVAELAQAPVRQFKKIDTLGFLAVGDGRHASYFLTAYLPGQPDTFQSTLNPARMWKKLVSLP